jgi:hypothetical protein
MASAIRLTEPAFAALLAEGSDELRPAIEAVREPRRRLVLERAGATASCWIGEEVACLLVPEGTGWLRAFALDFDELPAALMRALGVSDARRPVAAPVSVSPGELATGLAAAVRGEPLRGRLRSVLDGLSSHWRVSDGRAAVEVIATAAGSWAVAPKEPLVELRPVDGDWIARALDALLGGAHA